MESVRTCLGCRQRAFRSELLRVVARAGELVADQTATMSGRGAWVHAASDCVQSAISRRAFAKALRVEGPISTHRVLTDIIAAKATQEEQAE
ncbi:MAG: YlxR family protein [Microbacteriaceae bacterium]|nr:YlxR family protein [Microbacteriaceae bacterium]